MLNLENQLLFLVLGFFLNWLDPTVVLRLRLGIFHRLLSLGKLLGTGFGALLAFFVQHFFAAQQLEESFVSAVAFIPAGANDPRVAAFAIGKRGPTVSNSFTSASSVMR